MCDYLRVALLLFFVFCFLHYLAKRFKSLKTLSKFVFVLVVVVAIISNFYYYYRFLNKNSNNFRKFLILDCVRSNHKMFNCVRSEITDKIHRLAVSLFPLTLAASNQVIGIKAAVDIKWQNSTEVTIIRSLKHLRLPLCSYSYQF